MNISMEPSGLKRLAQAFAVLAVTVALTGMGRFSLSAEDRINAAFPPPAELEAQVDAALAGLPRQQRGLVRQELESQLKLRALTCAKGYNPGWGSSPDEIRRNIANSACFAHADAGINRWLGIVRMGPLLAEPPLRPLPQKPALRSATAFSGAIFAPHAGVAFLFHDKGYSLVDLNTAALLRRVESPQGFIGKFSPNGRLYTVEMNDTTEVRLTEDAALVAVLPKAREFRFHWLDDRTAIYQQEEPNAVRLLDFATLKEVDLPGVEDLGSPLPVPGHPDQFIIAQRQRATLFQIDRSAALPQVRALRYTQHTAFSSWSRNTSSLTADGRHYVSATSQLHIYSVDSQRLESIDTGRFWTQMILGTQDPDRVFLAGVLSSRISDPRRCYLYSISRRTFARLDCDMREQRPVYVPPFRTLGFLVDGGLQLWPSLDAGEPLSHYDQVRAWYDEDRQAWDAAHASSEASATGGDMAALARERIMQGARCSYSSDNSVLYKCRGTDDALQFQSTPCQPGREAGQVTVQAPPPSGMSMDPGRSRLDSAVSRWTAARRDEQRQRDAIAQARAPRAAQPPEFRYVPPEITEPQAVSASASSGQRCPYTPVEGEDSALEIEKFTLYINLFDVDPWKDSRAMRPAPAADDDEFQVDDEARRERCERLVEEYHAVGDELLRVYPKSLPAVSACFRTQAQRLDAEGRRLGCRIARGTVRP